jgi:hypothetical protein
MQFHRQQDQELLPAHAENARSQEEAAESSVSYWGWIEVIFEGFF